MIRTRCEDQPTNKAGDKEGASAVTTRHELIMSLVAGLSPIMKVWKRAVMTPYATAQSLHLTSVTGKTVLFGICPQSDTTLLWRR